LILHLIRWVAIGGLSLSVVAQLLRLFFLVLPETKKISEEIKRQQRFLALSEFESSKKKTLEKIKSLRGGKSFEISLALFFLFLSLGCLLLWIYVVSVRELRLTIILTLGISYVAMVPLYILITDRKSILDNINFFFYPIRTIETLLHSGGTVRIAKLFGNRSIPYLARLLNETVPNSPIYGNAINELLEQTRESSFDEELVVNVLNEYPKARDAFFVVRDEIRNRRRIDSLLFQPHGIETIINEYGNRTIDLLIEKLIDAGIDPRSSTFVKVQESLSRFGEQAVANAMSKYKIKYPQLEFTCSMCNMKAWAVSDWFHRERFLIQIGNERRYEPRKSFCPKCRKKILEAEYKYGPKIISLAAEGDNQSVRDRVRDIGIELNKLGGIDLMLLVAEEYVRPRLKNFDFGPNDLDWAWDGIGEWQR
jgi:hypothetical protein